MIKTVVSAYFENELCGDEYLNDADCEISFERAGDKVIMRIAEKDSITIDDARYTLDSGELALATSVVTDMSVGVSPELLMLRDLHALLKGKNIGLVSNNQREYQQLVLILDCAAQALMAHGLET